MLKKVIKFFYMQMLRIICKNCYETRKTQTPILLRHILKQKVFGYNRNVYWPVHFTSIVTHPQNICIGIDTSPGYMPGCYIQGNGKVFIGDYTQISANVGIISSNHNLYDTRKHNVSQVIIGKYCWLGMNTMILPGVELGDFTIVGAGSVVSKSFSDGYCVIAGNPAKIIKTLDKNECIMFENNYKYNGFVKNSNFDNFRKKNLNV
ncbi:MAG: acyltransferase [Arcobacteraceae bacterium]